MSQTKQQHTPGPWEATRGLHGASDKDRRCFWVVNQRDGAGRELPTRVCDVPAPSGVGGFAEVAANAALIAAAPELLEALSLAYRHGSFSHAPEIRAKMDSALRKAKGE